MERTATVLIVDDSPMILSRLRQILGQEGYQVVQAADGLEALLKYAEHDPDVVLLDMTMPNMDGMATLKELPMIAPAASVVMVTAERQKSVVMDALKLGAKDYVVKPFEATRVLAAVERLAEQRSA